MHKIEVVKKGQFPVSAKSIRDCVGNTLKENGITSNCELSIAIVGHAAMIEYAMKHLKESKKEASDHPVLSFPTNELEGPFVFPPDNTLHLGEIIVSYDKAVENAQKENKLVDDAVCDLACHGALHLIGIHHD